MNELQVNKINDKLYDDAKIFWKDGKNWSSKLWENLKLIGWKMEITRTMFVKIKDSNNNIIINSQNGIVNALFLLGVALR